MQNTPNDGVESISISALRAGVRSIVSGVLVEDVSDGNIQIADTSAGLGTLITRFAAALRPF